MSSRRDHVRDQFAVIMRKQVGRATHNIPVAPHNTPIASVHVESPVGSVPRPSHPAFDKLEEMTMKELQDVSVWLSLFSIKSRA